MWDWRPLDPVRSIKAKLGLLVAVSVTAGVVFTWYALVILDWWIRYTLPIAVALALAVTQLLAAGMTRPLRQMTAAARRMAAGSPAGPVDATSRDEVGELARAFTAMAAELATADEQRRELLANVAHEMRTPVTAIRAQVENLVDGVRPADPDALAEVLDRVERLAALLEDLLDLARAQGGAAPFRPVPTRLAPLIRDVATDVLHTHPGLRLRIYVPEPLVACVDPARLRQVVVNLLDNAARHGGATATVDVMARSHSDQAAARLGGAVIDVVDDGPGIAPQARADFDRRNRADGSRAGLGLAIARWAVALHRGRITVVEGDHGCHVRVELPASQEGTP